MQMLDSGRYRHYKGKDYMVYGIAEHTETGEALVVYRPLYGARGLSVRPLSMFQEWVALEGEQVQRFRLLEAIAADKLMVEV